MSNMPPPPPPPMAPPPGYQPYGAQAAPQYASFGARLGAYILDYLIWMLFLAPAIAVIFAGPSHTDVCTIDDELRLCEIPDGSTIAIAIVLGVIGLVGFLFLWTKKVGTTGQSWGMSAANVRVVDAATGQPIGQGRALGRWFARFLSGWACLLGYLWMLWDQRKQTWHDKLVSSIVVRA